MLMVAFDWPDMPLCSRASEDSRSATLTLCFCSSRSNSAKKDVPPKAVKAPPVVAEVVKTPKALEKEVATYSSILAWAGPWTEESGEL